MLALPALLALLDPLALLGLLALPAFLGGPLGPLTWLAVLASLVLLALSGPLVRLLAPLLRSSLARVALPPSLALPGLLPWGLLRGPTLPVLGCASLR